MDENEVRTRYINLVRKRDNNEITAEEAVELRSLPGLEETGEVDYHRDILGWGPI